MINTACRLQRWLHKAALSCTIACCAITALGTDRPRHQDAYWLVRYYGRPSYDYYVPWRALTNQPPWNPTSAGALPANLTALAPAAYEVMHQTRGTTHLLRFSSISINRIGYSGEHRALLTNKWFVVFTFSVDEPDPYYRYVVMLPDGTVAEERRAAPMARMERGGDKTSTAVTGPKQTALQSFHQGTRISSVQWDPLVSVFPFDLGSEVIRAHLLLREGYGLSESAVLQQIVILHYAPVELIRRRQLSLLDHLNHWYGTFYFGDVPRQQSGNYEVDVCLDRVVERVVRDGEELTSSKRLRP